MSRVTPNSPSEIPERFLHHGGPPGGFRHHAQEDAAIGVSQQDLVSPNYHKIIGKKRLGRREGRQYFYNKKFGEIDLVI